jgi:acetyl-CoA carboxylase carboxyl transferase subunit alpha
LKKTSYRTGIDVDSSVDALEKKLLAKKREVYGSLTRWQKLKIARHPNRPYGSDYIRLITDSRYELHGDRKFSDDPAIICGIAEISSKSIMIIAQEKGRGTKEKLNRNFGMARPEGYRKALRVNALAEKFKIPFLTEIPLMGGVVDGGDKGVPVIMADPTSPATKAYKELAGQVAAQLSIIHANKDKPASSFELAWEG